eukprot:13736777-Alexandrium_andersonii.AAC.1
MCIRDSPRAVKEAYAGASTTTCSNSPNSLPGGPAGTGGAPLRRVPKVVFGRRLATSHANSW